jgi:hypothetical protein
LLHPVGTLAGFFIAIYYPMFANCLQKKIIHKNTIVNDSFSVIRTGFEPVTRSLEGCCSIQLSYRTSLEAAKIQKSTLVK